MLGKQNRNRRATALGVAAISALGALHARANQTTWVQAANGLWTAGANWSSAPTFPNDPSADVVIGATGAAYQVTLNSDITVGSFSLNSSDATLVQSAGTFKSIHNFDLSAGTFALNGGTLASVTISPGSSGTFLLPTGGNGTLSGDTLGMDLTLNNGYGLNIINGISMSGRSINLNDTGGHATILFSGSQSLIGYGTFNFDGTANGGIIRSSGALTLGASTWIRTDTAGGTVGDASSSITSYGSISAMTSGKTLAINAGAFTGNGTLEALNGATLAIGSGYTNLSGGVLNGGYLHVGDNSTITLGGGAVLTNSASVFLEGAGSSFAAINGFANNTGTFAVANGRTFTLAPSFTNTGTLQAMNGGQLNLSTGTNSGTLIIDDGGTINLTGSATYTGTSHILGGGVLLCSSIQNFNGSLAGNITMGLAGSASFGPTANYSPAALLVTTSTNSAAAGAKINPGAGGLRLSGSASPAFSLAAGATPATMTLGGNVSVSGNDTGGLAQIVTSGTGAIDGTLDLGNAVRIFTIAQGPTAPDLLVSTLVTHGGIYKSGPGTMSLTHSNTYTSGTTLTDGTVEISGGTIGFNEIDALGTGSVVFSGGTLSILSDISNPSIPNQLYSNSGASLFINIGRLSPGTAGTFAAGPVTLGNQLFVTGAGTFAPSSVTLTQSTTIRTPAAITISSALSGAYAITFGDSQNVGTYTLSGASANTYSGITMLNSGTLNLNKSTGNAIAGSLDIEGGQVNILASNQIADASHLTINNGTLNLAGASETVGTILLTNFGAITGTGTLAATGIGSNSSNGLPVYYIAQNGSLNIAGTDSSVSGQTLKTGDWRVQHGTITLTSIGQITTNQATITLDGAGSTFTNLSSPINQGTINLDEGANFLIVSASQNPGTIQMDSQSKITLTTNLNLTSYIGGGTITTLTGSTLNVPNNAAGTLDRVKLDTNLSVGTSGGSSGGLYIGDWLTLENNHSLTLYGGSQLGMTTSGTIGGIGAIQLVGVSGNKPQISAFASGLTTTFGGGITVHGQGALVEYYGGNALVNQGTISADVPGQELGIDFESITNSGTLQATNGGILTIANRDAWSSTGTLAVLGNSTLNLGGTFTQATMGTLVHNSGTVNLTGTISGGLHLDATTGNWYLSAGTILNGTVSAANGYKLSVQNQASGELDGVTLNADLPVGDSSGGQAVLFTQNGLTLQNGHIITLYGGSLLAVNSSETIGGTGAIQLVSTNGNSPQVSAFANGLTTTFGGGITVHGQGALVEYYGGNALVNQGTISADVPGQVLGVDFESITNTGTLQAANGGILTIANRDAWSSTGTLAVLGNSTLNLGGTFSQATMGTLVHSSGTVNLTGTINNGLALSASTGSWYLNAGTINGGTVSAVGGSHLLIQPQNYGILDNVKLDTDMSIGDSAGNYAGLYLLDTLTMENGHAITVNGDSGLVASNNVTINGNGEIRLAAVAGSVPQISMNLNFSTLSFSGGVTVHGQGLVTQHYAFSTLNNQGTISADVAGQELGVGFDTFNNTGTLQATNGAILSVGNQFTNWNGSGGTLAVLGNSTLNLGGIFSQATMGTLVHSSGTVNLTGTINNGLALSASTGSWYLNAGTINGGTVSATGGSKLLIQPANYGILDNVKLDTDMSIGDSAGNYAGLYLLDSLTLENGHAITVNGDSGLVASNNVTINGNGEIRLAAVAGSVPQISMNLNFSTLSFGGGVTVHGQGLINEHYAFSTLNNQGTISADVAGQELGVSFDNFNNTGTLQAINGAKIQIASSSQWSNSGTINVRGGGFLKASTWSNAGTADISGAALIDYAGASPISSMRNQLASGFNHGQWNGVGINSTAAAATRNSAHPTAVGIAEATAIGLANTGLDGYYADDSSIIVRYTYSGDADLDGTVNSSDFDRLAANFGGSGKVWSDGDYNYDGVVNTLDFNALASNFGQVIGISADLPAESVQGSSLGTLVPEPAGTMMLLSIASISRRLRCRSKKTVSP